MTAASMESIAAISAVHVAYRAPPQASDGSVANSARPPTLMQEKTSTPTCAQDDTDDRPRANSVRFHRTYSENATAVGAAVADTDSSALTTGPSAGGRSTRYALYASSVVVSSAAQINGIA